LGELARQRVIEEFSITKTVDAYEVLYSELTDPKKIGFLHKGD
jgi:hypothetical protein